VTDVWPVVHSERQALFHDLVGVPSDRWSTPSLCPGWDIHDVLAHLVDDAKATRLGFLTRFAAAGFDFDRCNAAGVTRERGGTPDVTLAAFRAAIDRTSSAPAPRETRLVEIVVHGEDIRRPLGIAHDYPSQAVMTALRYQLAAAVGRGGGKERAIGLTLVPTDGAGPIGDGDVAEGSALALLLAVSGRPTRPGEIRGAGAARLCGSASP
jgi:uncharacterized protein (TIGR03083 family)